MIPNILSIAIFLLLLFITIRSIIIGVKNETTTNMSFKEAMDLVGLPIITFTNNDKKLNFLLDTGSDISSINTSVLPSIKYVSIDKCIDSIGIEGNKKQVYFCEMDITYNNKVFTEEFLMRDLDKAFNIVKEESGVQIHGILGSAFFQKYKYILDFESLKAQIK